LGVTFQPLDIDPGFSATLARDRDQSRRQIQASNAGPEFRGRDGGVACTASDVEYLQAGLDGCPRNKDVTDGGHLLRHRPVVAGPPHVVSHGCKRSPVSDGTQAIRQVWLAFTAEC